MIEFVTDRNPNEKDIETVESGLREFNRKHTGIDNPEKYAIYVKDSEEIKGGVVFTCIQPWAYVNLLWVDDSQRGQGYGAKLLKSAEQEAIKQGCTKMMLDTFSFQAPEFYKKHGYSEITTVEDYPIQGASRHWFRKDI